jgi:peptidoglycan/LPS O-acetylase OafA/YrhL
LTWHILILFGVWLLGVVSAVFGPKLFSFQPSVFKWTFLLISTGISFGSLLVARVEFLKWGALDQFLIGIGFSLLLAALAPMAWRFPLQGWAHYFSDFSYSVYLIHFPVIMFALSMGFDLFGNGTRMPFGLLALGWYACIFSLAIFMSWLVSQFTERKTATLRKWLYGLLSVRES